MKLSRRKLLFGSVVVGLAALYGLTGNLRLWLHEQIIEEFGDQMTADPQVEAFLTDYIEYLHDTRSRLHLMMQVYFHAKPAHALSWRQDDEKRIRNHLITLFVRSTNVIAVIERGQPFYYGGIFDPDINPCTNQLGAAAL